MLVIVYCCYCSKVRCVVGLTAVCVVFYSCLLCTGVSFVLTTVNSVVLFHLFDFVFCMFC